METDPTSNDPKADPEATADSEPVAKVPDPVPSADVARGADVAAAGSSPKKKGTKAKKRKESRGIETMFRTSYRVHIDLSALADTKANIMISINGIIISIIIASISPKIDQNPWLLIPTSVLLIGCMISMVYAVLAARPRVSSDIISLDDVRRNRANILFFGHFTSLSADDFVEGMSELLSRPDDLYKQMMRDIYGLGKVLKRKFALLRVAYTVFMIGLSTGIILYIIVYIWIVMTITPS